MKASSVVIIKENDPYKMVKRGIGLLGGLNSMIKPNSKVFIKPNLCTMKHWETGATTDPRVVEAFVNLIKDRTKDITIIESKNGAMTPDLKFKALGYEEMAGSLGIRLLNVSEGNLVKVENPDALALKKVKINEELLDCDVMVNIPVLKTNEITLVSLSLKNMFGVLPYRIKAKFHANIDEVLCDVNNLVETSLVILDGRIGMEGNGPTAGDPIKMGLMVFGTDPVAVDALGSRIMGVNPNDVSHITMAEKQGIGTTEGITVVGEKVEDVQRRFRLPGEIALGRKIRYWAQENRLASPFTNVLAKLISEYRKLTV